MKIEDWKRKGKQTNYVINIFVRKFFPFRFATCTVIIILDLISLFLLNTITPGITATLGQEQGSVVGLYAFNRTHIYN